jgi:restriction system protein
MITDYHRLMVLWHQLYEIAEPASLRAGRQPEIDAHEREMAAAHERAQHRLADDMLARIHVQEPSFFESMVIDVLLAMGYGGRSRELARRLGRTGDGGIDGVIAVDELGLDLIYLQAKRLKPDTVVPVSNVRDFVGSLDAHHAGKGIFVATGHFSPAAVTFTQQVSRRVALIDGRKLVGLMIRHNIGVRDHRSFQIKRLDADYFKRPSEPA